MSPHVSRQITDRTLLENSVGKLFPGNVGEKP